MQTNKTYPTDNRYKCTMHTSNIRRYHFCTRHVMFGRCVGVCEFECWRSIDLRNGKNAIIHKETDRFLLKYAAMCALMHRATDTRRWLWLLVLLVVFSSTRQCHCYNNNGHAFASQQIYILMHFLRWRREEKFNESSTIAAGAVLCSVFKWQKDGNKFNLKSTYFSSISLILPLSSYQFSYHCFFFCL